MRYFHTAAFRRAYQALDPSRQHRADRSLRFEPAWEIESYFNEASFCYSGRQDVSAAHQLGQAYMAQQRWDDAQRVYQDLPAKAAEPWAKRQAVRQLAMIASQQHTLEPMLAEVETRVAKDPSDLMAYWQLIEGYTIGGKEDPNLKAQLAQAQQRVQAAASAASPDASAAKPAKKKRR